MTLTAITNAKTYAWSDWLIGIMRSFLSGGSAALISGGGGAIAGITAKQQYIMMGSSFLGMGIYRIGEFLQLHGAPDKIQQTLQVAAEATDKAKEAISVAKTQVEETNPPKP
jgi:hypothetical protein